MPDIYDINFETQSNLLNVPSKRKDKIKAFLNALIKPLQWKRDLFFDDYYLGVSYPSWAFLNPYFKGDRVIWNDKCVYECLLDNGGTPNSQPTGGTESATYWFKTQDNFMGAYERSKFNSQIIVLEYALNRWFLVPQANPQIYIETNLNYPTFLMGQTGEFSSTMSQNSFFSTSYMGNNPSFVLTDFTVWVPILVFNDLAALDLDREKIVRKFVDKYRVAGIIYSVQTF